jgi:nitroreductase
MKRDISELLDFLTSRSSVREYSPTPVDDEDIQYVLECASTAPSAGNREAWDVVVVTDETIRETLSDAAFDQPHVAAAPVIFAVCANYIRSMSAYGERGILYAIEDATIATTYMMLALHARGLQSCWTGAFDEEEVKEILGLPTHVRPIALLAAGKGNLPRYRTGRLPISDHVHGDVW